MGFASGICKCLLILINIIFILIGLTILALGVVIKVGKPYVQPYLDDLLNQTSVISSAANVADAADAPFDASALINDVLSYADAIAIGLMVFGGFVFILGCLGSCGACCMVKWMLIIYIIVVYAILLAQAVIIGLLFTGKFDDKIRKKMKETIDEEYGGIDDYNPESLTWNFVMAYFECCGIDGYTDFNTAKEWQKKKTRKFTHQGFTQDATLIAPVMCCKMEGDFPEIEPKDSDCTIDPNDDISNWKTGCWDAVGDFIEKHRLTVIIVCACILGFEFLMGILAIILLSIELSRKKRQKGRY